MFCKDGFHEVIVMRCPPKKKIMTLRVKGQAEERKGWELMDMALRKLYVSFPWVGKLRAPSVGK